ncbi:MAG: YigZ family protein [Paludibacteraceae bacterium]|nr:YigZ family protein [Paludibacteraceae bacterium]
MSVETYYTITKATEGLYKEKGSKFISFVFPVQTLDEVKKIVADKRKEYYDARHVCYAYVLGPEATDFRANDDGEPSGTAGRPILGQINSKGLTNILVIVVRYFGGILLGTGGLVVAYKQATIDALDQAEIVEKTVDVDFHIQFEYPLLNDVMRIVKEENLIVLSQQFELTCEMVLRVRKAIAEKVKGRLSKVERMVFVEE